ncbi:CRISPR-associated endonuclease Cas1 [Persephonella sp. KM09-Lau-8]|uniref:CRISPR-associated endonuclease Cas1 n=1 Tax=Persephonella sp. KM09-Lau-8 TaxID=1158345 RepID=UPI00049802AB|nr:CRISPR-associated endonuclease Cas1 [Persephonella sp. KM09-Lau-8]
MNLYFLTQGIALKRKENQLAVYKDNKKISSYPLTAFKNIFLFGNIEITQPLINFLLNNQKYIVFLSSPGFFRGILIPSKTQSNINIRITQYRKFFDEKENIKLAKEFVLQKLNNIEKEFDINIYEHKKALQKAQNINTILGIEGVASTKMFEKFRKLLKDINLEFTKRTYNPPKDPINSILSSAYMVFYNGLVPEVFSWGFDPYLSFLHRKKGVHHAFVSDLMEIIRPSITMSVYKFLQNTDINEMEFVKTEKGVYLSNTDLKKLLKWIHENIYDEEVQKISKFLRTNFSDNSSPAD